MKEESSTCAPFSVSTTLCGCQRQHPQLSITGNRDHSSPDTSTSLTFMSFSGDRAPMSRTSHKASTCDTDPTCSRPLTQDSHTVSDSTVDRNKQLGKAGDHP